IILHPIAVSILCGFEHPAERAIAQLALPGLCGRAENQMGSVCPPSFPAVLRLEIQPLREIAFHFPAVRAIGPFGKLLSIAGDEAILTRIGWKSLVRLALHRGHPQIPSQAERPVSVAGIVDDRDL